MYFDINNNNNNDNDNNKDENNDDNDNDDNNNINVKKKDINDENNGYVGDGKYEYKDIYNDKDKERND